MTTLDTLQLELTAKTDQLQASLSTVQSQLQLVVTLCSHFLGRKINAIFDSAGLTVAPGGGARTNALNTPADAGINTSLNDVFHALGVPGFATGGIVGEGGGGKPGMDSIPLCSRCRASSSCAPRRYRPSARQR